MSDELSDTIELQNIATLQLITSLQSLSIGLTTITSNFKIVVDTMTRGFLDVLEGSTHLRNSLSNITANFDQLDRATDTLGKGTSGGTSGGASGTGNLFGGTLLGKGFEGFDMKELFTEGFDLGGAGSGIGKRAQGLKSVAGGALGGLGKSFGAGLSMMGPQMLALSLIMKPIGALLNGIFAPLEMITDIFGAVGDILGLLLVPIMKEVGDVLLPILPILVDVVKILIPVISLLMIPMSLLGETMQLLSAGIQVLTGGLAGLMDGFGSQVTGFVDGLADNTIALIGNTDQLFQGVSAQEAANAQISLDSNEITGTGTGKQNMRFEV